LPVCENLAETLLSLPMFPGLDIDQIDFVIGAIKEFFVK
jgi:dTDP-4-amino-4,6-dideoxygalactose transaminase